MALFIMNKQTGRYEKSSGQNMPRQTIRPSQGQINSFQPIQPQKTVNNGVDWSKLIGNIGGMANDVAKGIVNTPLRIGESILDIPVRGVQSSYRGAKALLEGKNFGNILNASQYAFSNGGIKDFNLPWLGKQQTYQNDFSTNVVPNVIDNKMSLLQAAGHIAQPIMDIPATFYGGSAGRGVVKGISPFLKSVGTGSLIGGGYGMLGGIQNGDDFSNVLKNTAQNAAVGGIAGGALHGVLSSIGKMSNASTKTKTSESQVILPSNDQTIQISKGKAVPYTRIQSQPVRSVNPLIQEAGKQRGFAETIQQSSQTSPQLKKLLNDSTYTPQGNDELIKQASSLIKKDIGEARNVALNGSDNVSVATASELIKHYQTIGDYDMAAEVAKNAAQKLTEHGRAIQAASLYNKLTPEGILRFAQKELDKSGKKLTPEQSKELTQMAQDSFSAKGEDKAIKTGQMLNRIQEMVPSRFIDQAITVWKAGLLSNPTTHLRNIVGNASMTGLENAKDVPAVLLDKVASIFTGKRTKALPNLGAQIEGAGIGAKKALTFLKTGVDVDQTLGKIDYHQVNLPPVLKQYTQAVFRALGAEDKVFKETLFKKSLYEQAQVEGINQGLKGVELKSATKNLYQKPTPDMVKLATEDALYGTFNNPNKLASGISHGGPAVDIIAPFKRTPLNIAGRIIDYSPLGLIKAGYQGVKGAGQRKVVEDLARAITGMGVMGVGYGLGKAGKMTGNYPTDPTERATWEAQNLQPNALKFGGTSYAMNAISPIGNLLGLGSGVNQLQTNTKPEAMPAALAALGGQTLINQTFLQGVSGALNALSDPARNASTWANSMAGSVIPSVIGAATRAVDPTLRQTNGMGESIQSRVPFASQGLLPKTNVFGEDRTYGTTPMERAGQFFNPFSPREINQSPVIDEINRLNQSGSQISLTHPNKNISIQGFKIGLTPEEFTRLEKQTGGAIKTMLNKSIQSPVYQGMSDYDKASVLNNIIKIIRQTWNVQNIGKLTNSQKQLYQQVQDKVKLKTPYYKP